ncbi:MAG TPA: hypothetical protein VFK38_08910 [Candidatus Limnocylindrales bacterium]|nr:hypothetical protein [Candidatus Limnocylindrales bacterium]
MFPSTIWIQLRARELEQERLAAARRVRRREPRPSDPGRHPSPDLRSALLALASGLLAWLIARV